MSASHEPAIQRFILHSTQYTSALISSHIAHIGADVEDDDGGDDETGGCRGGGASGGGVGDDTRDLTGIIGDAVSLTTGDAIADEATPPILVRIWLAFLLSACISVSQLFAIHSDMRHSLQ